MRAAYTAYIGDTIAALSTAPGAAPHGIVRLSGPRAFELARTIFRCGRTVSALPRFGVVDGSVRLRTLGGELPAQLYSMRAPHSYTRQDVAEIHILGAPVVLEAVLAEFVAGGARPARAGEFTLRAFLNGRIDLAQAEAVAGITAATNAREAAVAARLLAGGLAAPLERAQKELVRIRSQIELGLDFSDQDVPIYKSGALANELRSLAGDIDVLLERTAPTTPDAAPRVLLFGRVNAGKSTLFNRLCGKPRVIASSAPGTTRDLIETHVAFDGVQAVLVDAAGQSAPDDALNAEISVRAASAAAASDLVLCVVDPTCPLPEQVCRCDDLVVCASLLAVNKTDLLDDERRERIKEELADWSPVFCSAKEGTGIRALAARIAAVLHEGSAHDPGGAILISVRQRDLAGSARDAALHAAEALENGAGEEIAAFECRRAAEALDEIAGREARDEVLDAVFANFCVGK